MWLELSTCRQFGMGAPGPIPITATFAYVDRYGLPEWAVAAMISLDDAWREAEARKAPKPAPDARTQRRHGSGRRRHGR